jgi:hypothetical protein
MWALLKTHFHTASTKRLNALSLNPTSGAFGYSNPNQFAAFAADDESTDTTSTSHTLANVTMSTIGTTTMSPKMLSALQQLAANQTAMMTQMAALTVAPPRRPPINQIAVPTQQLPVMQPGIQFTQGTAGGYGRGYGGRTFGGGRSNRGRGSRRGGRGTFAQATGFGAGTQIVPAFAVGQAGRGIPSVPNPVKRFNNWNYCFSCGFDVEYGHTSMT